MKSETIGKLAEALCKAQSEMKAAELNAVNPFLKNKYADLGSIIEAVRVPLAENGLSFSQMVTSEQGSIGLESMLMHSSGEWISTSMTLPFGDEKGKSLAQAAGSVITYLRRYQLAALLGVYAGDDDDGSDKPKKQTAKHEPEPKIDTSTLEPSSLMTLEMAQATETSKGQKYGEMDVPTLTAVLNGIQKALDNNGLTEEKRVDLLFKKDAAIVLLKNRNGS